MPQSFAGEDISARVDVIENRVAYSFAAATLVRWWLSKTRDQTTADYGPTTVTDGAGNSFAGGFFYAIIPRADSADLEGDYYVGVEVTVNALATCFCDRKLTILRRGMT